MKYKRQIRKPIFIVTYAISLAFSFIMLGCIGALIYSLHWSDYETQIQTLKRMTEFNLNNIIDKHINKNEVTREDISIIRQAIVTHYTDTEQFLEVYFDGDMIADSSKTAIMTYVGPDDHTYYLEIANPKYLTYFDTPEINKYLIKATDEQVGFRPHPFLAFVCNEFYVDLESFRFVPIKCTIISGNEEPGPIVEITPDQSDVEGYTLIKTSNDQYSIDSRYSISSGVIAGYECDVWEDEFLGSTGGVNDYGVPYFTKQTNFSVKNFNEVYGSCILIGQYVVVIGSLILALIPAVLIYNTNKRKFDIYEYRMQTTNAMAHDLKTPLATIAGYAESLSYHIGSDKQEYYADKIGEKVSQMTGMINNILEFSKSETLSGTVNKESVDIVNVIDEIIADNEYEISSRSLKINFDQKNVSVNTDRELFKQALANLIGNAVLHSKEGTGIDICCDKESVVIANTVAEKIDDIKSIRQPFVKGSESRGSNGSGLGLAIADNNLAMLRYKLDLKLEDDRFYAIVRIITE